MRVNAYAEELTDRIRTIKFVYKGTEYVGLRFYLYNPVSTPDGESVRGKFINQYDEDGSSAITIYANGTEELTKLLEKAIRMLKEHDQNKEGKYMESIEKSEKTFTGDK